jgi:hypothetical protein
MHRERVFVREFGNGVQMYEYVAGEREWLTRHRYVLGGDTDQPKVMLLHYLDPQGRGAA